MISNQHQCIFVHIPKTGGTSIENLIWGNDWSLRSEADLWMGNIRPGFNKYQSGGLQHLLAKQIRQEVGNDRFERYYKFAFVRNPWDKVVSQYKYLQTRPMLRKYMGLNRFSSFSRYVRVLADAKQKHVQSFEQWKFLQDDQGRSLVDFVGHFEKLQEDFDVVAEKLELTSSKLPHDMKSAKRRPYQSYYNAKTRQIVAEVYCKDIEVFGYQFDS